MSAAFVSWIRFSAVFGLIGCSAGLAWGAEEAPLKGRIVIGDGGEGIRIVEVQEPEVSPWWIGLICEPASDARRQELNLDGKGLVIQQVIPNSPAAAAGLKENDIVVAVGETAIESLDQLIAAVTKANGQVLKLEIIREGAHQHINVTPKKRPAEFGTTLGIRLVPNPTETPLLPAVGAPPVAGEPPAIAVAPSPGAVIPALVPAPAATLPDDMEVVIRKQGSEPARIKVTQGNKTWKTVEGELDMLPPAARPFVDRALQLSSPSATSALPGAPLQFRLQVEGPGKLQFGNETPGQRAAGKVQGEGMIIRLREGNEEKREAHPQPGAPAETRVRWHSIERPDAEKVDRAAQKLQELKEQLERERDQLQRARQIESPRIERPDGVTSELRTLQNELQRLRDELSRLRKEVDEVEKKDD
ncbi:MAG TPA: PDZ domain-containing protein [Planctomycetaceae bacterium]|nr:PDZ domain-containing protein [Planctomycetaceae bacterium]